MAEASRECHTCFRLCDSCDALWPRPPRTIGERLYLVGQWVSGMVWFHRHHTFWFTCRDCREIHRRQVIARREGITFEETE